MTYPINGYGDYWWMSDERHAELMEHVDELIEIRERTGIEYPIHTDLEKVGAYESTDNTGCKGST